MPRIYPFYAGPPRAELTVVAARAQFDASNNLHLVGHVAATEVPDTADDADTRAYYVWGLNRGTTGAPGPYRGGPQINFDAAVVVAVTEAGTAPP